MNIFKSLIVFIFVLLVSPAYAACNVQVQDLYFGDVLREPNKEFNTSGYLSISCDPEDIGKTMSFVFSRQSIFLGGDTNKEIPVQVIINGNLLVANEPYAVPVSSITLELPVVLKMMDLSKSLVPGLYSNNIGFYYTY